MAQVLRDNDVMTRLGYDYEWWSWSMAGIVAVRNKALQRAIQMEYDYLLMQDSDVYSPSNIGALALMLETARTKEATLTTAIVGLRRQPITANVQPVKAGEVYEGEKCGAGMILIDVNQVAAWNYDGAWFDITYKDERKTEFDHGEDIYFSKLVKRQGGSLWIDGRVPTRHEYSDPNALYYPGAAASLPADHSVVPGNK